MSLMAFKELKSANVRKVVAADRAINSDDCCVACKEEKGEGGQLFVSLKAQRANAKAERSGV